VIETNENKLYDLFKEKWDSCHPNYLRSDGTTRWSFWLGQVGVRSISPAERAFHQLWNARHDHRIVIKNPSRLGEGQGYLLLSRELAEKILVLGLPPG
jgi:hypothetical protein